MLIQTHSNKNQYEAKHSRLLLLNNPLFAVATLLLDSLSLKREEPDGSEGPEELEAPAVASWSDEGCDEFRENNPMLGMWFKMDLIKRGLQVEEKTED